MCWIVGIEGRKPRNFPPFQATGKPGRGGRASEGRPGHFHRGLSYLVPVTQKYSPLGQGAPAPLRMVYWPMHQLLYKMGPETSGASHILTQDVIQRRVRTVHRSTPVFRDPGLFHRWLWVPRRVRFLLLDPPFPTGKQGRGRRWRRKMVLNPPPSL